MAIVTLKEMEEKYGWGFVVFKNVADLFSFPTEGEYIIHCQDKGKCRDLIDDTNSQKMGIYSFGKNPAYRNVYRMSSLFYTWQNPAILDQ